MSHEGWRNKKSNTWNIEWYNFYEIELWTDYIKNKDITLRHFSIKHIIVTDVDSYYVAYTNILINQRTSHTDYFLIPNFIIDTVVIFEQWLNFPNLPNWSKNIIST